MIIFFIAISLSDVPFGVLHQRKCIITSKRKKAMDFSKTLQAHYSSNTLWIEIVEMANLATLVQNGLVKVAF
ncbi:hypothetical protein EJP75_13430 [Acinetobacter baumannii]|nr:hypothetical protein EJP75_13430 [Acinetobacter baumannii]